MKASEIESDSHPIVTRFNIINRPLIENLRFIKMLSRLNGQARSRCYSSPLAAAPRPLRRSRTSIVTYADPQPKTGPPGGQMLVFVPPHPLVKHWMAICRNSATPSPMFRSALAELGRCLIYEAMRDFLPTMDAQVETPRHILCGSHATDQGRPHPKSRACPPRAVLPSDACN